MTVPTDRTPQVSEVSFGKNRFRTDRNGHWQVLMWGWWPNGSTTPSYRFATIPADKVPNEVKKMFGVTS